MPGFLKKSALLSSFFLLAACSTVSLDEPAPIAAVTSDGTVTQGVMDPFHPASPLAQKRSVYFAYDSFVIESQYYDLINMHANYLRAHPQQLVRIEGHADARGSSEYNLALGQRRSDAVSRRLGILGVNANQVEAISFGKERPRALGQTEADYAENRRADFQYLLP